MNTVLYCSANGAIYEARAFGKADIDRLVQDQGLHCLTSADGQYDFWFSPSTRGCQRRANQSATELLLASSSFTAKNVPLLHGCVVVATHDSDGDLDGLSWQQLDVLAKRNRSLKARDTRILDRRVQRDARRQRKNAAARTERPAVATPTPVAAGHR